MKNLLSNVMTGTLVACALVVTGLVVRREFFAPPAGVPPVLHVAGWEQLAQVGQRFGPARTAVTIVEFSDFQCPYCAQAQADLRRVREKHPGQIAVVYRHLPLDAIHPHARAASLASECAGAQGRFEAYHDLLYASQDSIGRKSWVAFAQAAGVSDTAAFERCVADRRFADVVERDVAAAEALKLDATPVFIINGRMISGVLPPDAWDKLIADEVRTRTRATQR